MPDEKISVMPDAATLDGTELVPAVQAGGNVKTTTAAIAALLASDYIDYAGPPLVAPPLLQHIVVDVNGRQWQYFGGGWN